MKNIQVIFIMFLMTYCSSDMHYIRDSKGKNIISYFDFNGDDDASYTIIAYGKLTSPKLPDAYLKVRNHHGWEWLIEWRNDSAYVYEPYGYIQSFNIKTVPMKLFMMDDVEFYKIFWHDSTSHYVKVKNY